MRNLYQNVNYKTVLFVMILGVHCQYNDILREYQGMPSNFKVIQAHSK